MSGMRLSRTPNPKSLSILGMKTNINIPRETSGTLVLQIFDTGIGISKSFIHRLFQPFGQANKEIQKTFGGTGLGLWISKIIVELMGGTIQVESEEGKGTRFTIRLNLKVAKPENH
jgi:signal transduction histidine kinase